MVLGAVSKVREAAHPAAHGAAQQRDGYLWAEKREIVQLLKLAVNPMTIINSFPANVPGYFLFWL